MAKRGGTGERKPSQGRSATISVRLDPRLRYIVELAARQQRRSLSSYIEWAIEESLDKVKFPDGADFVTKAQELWDVYEPDRVAKLAAKYPSLMDYEQQRIWKVVDEYGPAWLSEDHLDPQNDHLPFGGRLKLPILRSRWNDFKAVASGKASTDSLADAGKAKKS